MRVLHISTSDRGGGAAIAAYRMMEAMNRNCINSKMLVLYKNSDSNDVIPVSKSKCFEIIAKLNTRCYLYMQRLFLHPSLVFSCGMFHVRGINDNRMLKWADVIYIHWILGGYLNIKDIGRIIAMGKPTFVFLHDMWYLTGGCHYSMNCKKWENDCKKCPQIDRKVSGLAHLILKKKKKLYHSNNVFVISPSNWLADCARKSLVFKDLQIFTIPNTVNDKVFRLMNKQEAREILNLPQDRKLILFGAVGGMTSPYKGWKYVEQLMERIGNEVDLVVFGKALDSNNRYMIHSIGKMTDEYSLAILYNAVDVFISPTQAEAFGQTIVESISCGTKAVVFNVGGVSDIITHLDNGYLAHPNDLDDFERGVMWAIGAPSSEKDRLYIHESVKKKFSYSVIAKMHIKIIDSVIHNTTN